MYNILLWGTGILFNRYISVLKDLQAKNDINIIGVTSNEGYRSCVDDIPFIPKNKLATAKFDYVMVLVKSYHGVIEEGKLYGIAVEKFIPFSVLDVEKFTFQKYSELRNRKISIVAKNCWGGVTSHRMGLPFLSPFINMFLMDDDYIKLMEDFERYIKAPLVLYDTGYNEDLKIHYPIFKLQDILLYMNHYSSVDEAVAAWQRRVKRINIDQLFFMTYTKTPEIAKAFSERYKGKGVCFTPVGDEFAYSGIMQVSLYDNDNTGHDFWRYVNNMGSGNLIYYDVWSLLLDNKFVLRAK